MLLLFTTIAPSAIAQEVPESVIPDDSADAPSMEWQNGVDEPVLAVTSPSTGGDRELKVDVVASCGTDVLTYSFDAGLLAETDTAWLEFPELDAVADWPWISYTAHLFVRLTLSDPETGAPMRLDSAPERWLAWDGSHLQSGASDPLTRRRSTGRR